MLLRISTLLAVLVPSWIMGQSSNTFEADALWRNGQYKQAFVIYERLGDAGDAYSAGMVGHCYRFGLGVDKTDDSQALKYSKIAAAGGDAIGAANAGLILINANSATSKQEAEEYFKLAIARRDQLESSAVGQTRLARLLSGGNGIAKNEAESLKWYRMAAEQGDLWDSTILG